MGGAGRIEWLRHLWGVRVDRDDAPFNMRSTAFGAGEWAALPPPRTRKRLPGLWLVPLKVSVAVGIRQTESSS